MVEVLEEAKVNKLCMEGSFEAHIGSEDSIDMNFVKNHFEIFYFYPLKNEKSFGKEEALKLYLDTMNSTLARFEKKPPFLPTAAPSTDTCRRTW